MPGRDDRSAQPEREHRGSRCCRRSGTASRRRQDGEVGLAAELVVERPRSVRRLLVRPSRVLEPARADLGVGPAVDPALRAGTGRGSARQSRRSPLWLNAKRPAGSSNGWVSGSRRVESRDGRRRWTRTRGRLLPADAAGALRVVPEGAQVAVAA